MAKERFDAVYARQSVDKKDSVSIETQIDDCKVICDEKVMEYADKGYSGKNTERPDLRRLIADVERGIIKRIVVYKLDRISRNINDFYKLYEIMSKNDCEFVSRTEGFDTSNSMGRAMMGILAVFAQMERENIQMRIKDNYYFRIKDGRWASGRAPYGYKNGKASDGKPTLIPIYEELEVVHWMFMTYIKSPNISLGKIQTELIKKGIHSKKSEKGFSRTTIGRILSNPVYAVADQMLYKYYQKQKITFSNDAEMWDGSVTANIIGKKDMSRKVGDLEGATIYLTNFKGIIDSRYFIMAQERLMQNRAIASDNSPNHKLKELSGLIKCAECGSAIKMQTYPTLTCTGRSQKKICTVSFKGQKLEMIQENVAEKVQEYMDNIKETMDKKMKRRARERKEIQKLEKQIDNLIELASFSENVSDAVKEKIDRIQTEIYERQLKMKMDVDSRDLIEIRVDVLSMFVEEGKAIDYRELDTEHRQTILRAIINKIYVHNDCSVDIDWKD